MPPFLVWFLVNAAGHPLLVGLAPAVVVTVFVWWLGRGTERFSYWSRAATAAIAVAALVAYGTSVIWYATDAHYFDAAEPTMTIVGFLFMQGQPLYPEPASAERYAHIYGPLAFIAHGMVQGVFGAGIEESKWLGAAAGLIGLVSTWLALKPVTTRSRALVLTGTCALIYLTFRNYTFWTRPDALLIAGVALGLLAAVRAQGVAAAIGVGLAAGVLANLKFTGPIYVAPLVAMLALGTRPWLAWVAVASFLDAHPGLVVQMAYNGHDRPTYAGPVLTFRSGVYLVDGPAMQEYQLSRMPLPTATLVAIRTCRIDVWLVPRGTEPFAGPNRYLSMARAPIFPDAFRTAFREAYVPDGHTVYFDVWRCRSLPKL